MSFNPLNAFLEYAAEFEKTYQDDNWERLLPYFAHDATYEVSSRSFPCLLRGPEAILSGTRKSLDGFDRRFDRREIVPGSDLKLDDSSMSIDWQGIYHKEGLEPCVLNGVTTVDFEDDKIVRLRDSFPEHGELQLLEWLRRTGFAVDLSYV